jgi:hypothetical protein
VGAVPVAAYGGGRWEVGENGGRVVVGSGHHRW